MASGFSLSALCGLWGYVIRALLRGLFCKLTLVALADCRLLLSKLTPTSFLPRLKPLESLA
jgi:hypothetical protein